LLSSDSKGFNFEGGLLMKKRQLLLLALVAVMALALFGCGSSSNSGGQSADQGKTEQSGGDSGANAGGNAGGGDKAPSGQKTNLSFPTGTTTGVYYPLGAALAKLWNDKLPDVNVSSQASNGSVQNLNFMQQGEAQVSLTPIGTLWEAYNGQNSFDGRAYKDVRVLAAIYPNVDQMVVAQAINSVSDLKGKGFVPGATASATEIDSKRILEAYGLDYEDMKVNFVGFTEATDLMRNKQVQGAMIQAGIPAAAVTEMTSTAGAKLISLEDDKIKAMMDKYPWFVEYTIPAGTYDGQDKDIKTVAQVNMLVADTKMPDDVAYNLVKTLWENVDTIGASIPVMKTVKVENATTGLADVPLHPGAEKFYKEKGILK
jgi:hypothetical protein